jgi:hypothetical protein
VTPLNTNVKAEFQSPVIVPQTIYVKVLMTVFVGLTVVIVVVHCDVAAAAGTAKVNGISNTKIKKKRRMPFECFMIIVLPPN